MLVRLPGINSRKDSAGSERAAPRLRRHPTSESAKHAASTARVPGPSVAITVTITGVPDPPSPPQSRGCRTRLGRDWRTDADRGCGVRVIRHSPPRLASGSLPVDEDPPGGTEPPGAHTPTQCRPHVRTGLTPFWLRGRGGSDRVWGRVVAAQPPSAAPGGSELLRQGPLPGARENPRLQGEATVVVPAPGDTRHGPPATWGPRASGNRPGAQWGPGMKVTRCWPEPLNSVAARRERQRARTAAHFQGDTVPRRDERVTL